MRRIWRLAAFFVIIVAHAVRLQLKVWRTDDGQRSMLAARGQQKGTQALCKLLGIRVEIEGELPEDGAMLAVSNHLSLLDPFVLAANMPVSFAAKAEIAKWPIIGWICKLVGVIFVVRERRMETGRFVDQVQSRIREGIRVLVFPEGTTNDGITILPFKTGAFAAVADMNDGSILPIHLRFVSVDDKPATGALLKQVIWERNVPMLNHAWKILAARKMVIAIRIGEPIGTAQRDRKELARRSQDAVVMLGTEAPVH